MWEGGEEGGRLYNNYYVLLYNILSFRLSYSNNNNDNTKWWNGL